MDRLLTPSDRIKSALEVRERSRSWLARSTQIPLTTLDRKLRGEGYDFTLAQTYAIAQALEIGVTYIALGPDTSADAERAAS